MKSLPNELLIQVLSHCAGLPATLKRLSLVNKLFYNETRRHLFKEVRLVRSLEDSLERLEMLNKLHLCRYVEVIAIQGQGIIPEEMLLRSIDLMMDHTLTETFQKSLPPHAEKFRKAILKFFTAAKNNLKVIELDMASEEFLCFTRSDCFHQALNQSISSALGQVKMTALEAFDLNLVMSDNLNHLFGRVLEPYFHKDTDKVDKAVMTENRGRIQKCTFQMWMSCGEELPLEDPLEGIYYLWILKRCLPNLTNLELSLPTESSSVDISHISHFPLTKMFLHNMKVRNLPYVLEHLSDLRDLRLSVVELHKPYPGENDSEYDEGEDDNDQDEESEEQPQWSKAFEALADLPITSLRLNDLCYEGTAGRHWSSRRQEELFLCTTYREDIEAAKQMFAKLGLKEQQVCLHGN